MLRCSYIYAGFIVAMGLSCGLVIAQDSSPIFEPPPIIGAATLPPPTQNGSRLPSFPSSANARPLVVDVIIQGARDEERARSYIRTKKEYEFDEGILQADVRRLITSNQFQNVRTMKKQVVEGIVVIFELTERPRINYILFHGNRGYTDKKLLKVCELKQGEPMNAYEVEEGRRRLEEHYHSKGYPKAQIGILEGDKPTDKGVAYAISEGYLQRIAEVSFEGNTFASDSVLKTKIESKPGFMWLFFNGKLNRQKLDSDVEKLTAYYHDFGFFRARVGREITFDEEGKWATLKFVIEEGQRYHVRNVSIVGNEKFRTEPVLDALTLKSNKPFSRGEMNKDLTLIRDLYGSQGHIFSDVQANPRFRDEPGEIDLVYKIQEGEPFRVGQINVHIAGEFPHTRRNVVLNKLSLRPGDLIDMRQIRDSERRLKFSQLFETEQTGGEPPRIVVRPPELSDAEVAANKKKGVRGQSPEAAGSPTNSTTTPSGDASPMSFVPTYNIDVFVPQVSENFHEEIPNQALPYPYRLPANHAVNAVPDTIRRLPSIYSEQ